MRGKADGRSVAGDRSGGDEVIDRRVRQPGIGQGSVAVRQQCPDLAHVHAGSEGMPGVEPGQALREQPADPLEEIRTEHPLAQPHHPSPDHGLGTHAGQDAEEELATRFVNCFVQAADDAGLPDDPELRSGLRAYMEWAVADVMAYSPRGSSVPADLSIPRWSWTGLEPAET